jgi:hypothetical protein
VPIKSDAQIETLTAAVGPEQVAISGDDILIEYCERLLNAITKINEFQLNPMHSSALVSFITH